MSDVGVNGRSGSRASQLEAHLDRLGELVSQAKAMPLSASIMVNKGEIQDLVSAIRQQLPDEIRRANQILRERDDILERAEDEARRIVREAEEEQDRLVSRTDVVREADREADRLIQEAEEHARQLRLEAEDYVDAKLANFEVVLQKTLQTVARGRDKLQGTLHSDQLSEDQLEAEQYEDGQPTREPFPEQRASSAEDREA